LISVRFFCQAEDGIRDRNVTGVQTCALPISNSHYWDNGKTVLQKVTFLPINQESAATKRYLAGDIDITESFPKNLYQKLLKDIRSEERRVGKEDRVLWDRGCYRKNNEEKRRV